MAITLTKRTRSGGGNGGDSRPVSWNPLLKMTADRDDTRAICELQVDAYGLEAGSKVALTLLPAKPVAAGKKGRPELKNFRAGAKIGSSPKFGQEVMIIAERSYKDNKETIDGLPVVKANWIKAAVHDLEDTGPSAYAVGYVHVSKINERKNKSDESYFIQNRSVYMDQTEQGPDAFSFNSMDEFVATAGQWLEHDGQNLEIIVRVTNNNAVLSGEVPEGEAEMLHKSLRLFWNRDEGRQMTVEESLNFFLDGAEKLNNGSDNPDYGLWRGLVEAAGTEDANDYSFDAVVNRVAPTGSTTLENLQEKRVTQSNEEQNLFNMQNGEYTDRVFIRGTLLFRHQPLADNPDQTRLISTDTFALDRYGPTYLAAELPGARPDDVQAVLDLRAKERGETRYQDMKAARNAQKDDANENLNMDNNDPAPGGLTPSA
jgi:hypothetical protein